MATTYKVGIVMGSDSDWPTMKGTVEALKDFGIQYDVDVISAHRTPDVAVRYAKQAEKKGYAVLIAGAGGAAHIAGGYGGHRRPDPVAGGPRRLAPHEILRH